MADRLTPEALERLQKIRDAATPGKWRWHFNLACRDIQLESDRWQVMDFRRWGMNSAQPAFYHPSTGYKLANELGEIEPGREHHADWHRVLTHPNAQVIVEAVNALPALLAMARESLSALPKDEAERLIKDALDANALANEKEAEAVSLRNERDRLRAERDELLERAFPAQYRPTRGLCQPHAEAQGFQWRDGYNQGGSRCSVCDEFTTTRQFTRYVEHLGLAPHLAKWRAAVEGEKS